MKKLVVIVSVVGALAACIGRANPRKHSACFSWETQVDCRSRLKWHETGGINKPCGKDSKNPYCY